MEFGRHRAALRSSTKLARARGMYIFPIAGARKWIDVSILIFINFLNFADRFNLSGLLVDIQKEFNIMDDDAGLIQTVSRVVYMLSAPLFGILGDRYNRKFLLALGVFIWNAANIGASFMDNFWAFLGFRALFGVGQACYTVIAPTIIGDLLVGDVRTRTLTVFFMAVPIGNGLGYIVGPAMAFFFGTWRASLRFTPAISVVNIFLLIFLLKEPKRGLVEGSLDKDTPLCEDLRYLLRIPSFICCTFGYVAICFSTGVIQWWNPKLNHYGFLRFDPNNNFHEHSAIFGGVTIFAGFFGITLGYLLTYKLKKKYPQVDPIVCGLGLMFSSPFLMAATLTSMLHKEVTYVLLCFGFMFLNVNWTLTMDICLSVVDPTRRSTAVGIQMLFGAGMGDAGSPYVTGVISEQLTYRHGWKEFEALRVGYLAACLAEIIGGFFFFLNSVFIERDQERVRLSNQGLDDDF